MKTDTAVIITAAGLSGRMGMPKALLPWDAEMNFLEKIISTYTRFGCGEIIVVLNEKTYSKCSETALPYVVYILNPHPELERMYSIQLGLKAINNANYCFIQAIDNPFINQLILEEIYLHRAEEGYVSPKYYGKSGHPVLLSKTIIDYICQIEIGKLHFNEVLKSFPQKDISLEFSEILININKYDDYQKCFIHK
jgi:CTP:molybdopterin cytidylyltransferase MocA